jgi:hypothetical protein
MPPGLHRGGASEYLPVVDCCIRCNGARRYLCGAVREGHPLVQGWNSFNWNLGPGRKRRILAQMTWSLETAN